MDLTSSGRCLLATSANLIEPALSSISQNMLQQLKVDNKPLMTYSQTFNAQQAVSVVFCGSVSALPRKITVFLY